MRDVSYEVGHIQRRARERFDIHLSEGEVEQLLGRLLAGEGTGVQRDHRGQVTLIEIHGVRCRVKWDRQQRRLFTIMPVEREEAYR